MCDELLNKKYYVPRCHCQECQRKRAKKHEESRQKSCQKKLENNNDLGLNILNQIIQPKQQESTCSLLFRNKWNAILFKKKTEKPANIEKPWLKDCCLTCEPPCEPTSERNFVNFICDGIGVAAFFVLATIMFWLSVTQYVYQGIIAIYKSGRKTRLIALVILGLFLLCLIISLATAGRDKKAAATKCNLKRLRASYANHTAQPQPLDCENNPAAVRNNITITITDNCAREVFKQSKLFAIPTEMKHPPALLVYLRDVILRNY